MDGTVYDVTLPLTSNVDPVQLRTSLGIPDYVDLDYFPMKSAMVTLWASMTAPKLHEQYASAFEKKVRGEPVPAWPAGGPRVNVRCQGANGKASLARSIK